MAHAKRVAVVGVDCLTPQLLFDRYLDDLPFVKSLLGGSAWGRLRSTTPPITIPAWLCMATSKDPGQLGIYGFRNRLDHSYQAMSVADASWLKAPTLWQILSRRRRPSLVLGVPLTYPPHALMGKLVSGVPVPADAEQHSYPASFASELDALSGPSGYIIDVGDFRTRPTADLYAALQQLRDVRFKVARELARSEDWDLLFLVDMSVDRLHHALWAHAHPEHPLHDPSSPFTHLLHDFYVELDGCLQHLFECFDDDTAVLLVSDHGAQTMEGGVRFNEWLIAQGDLVLKQRPDTTSRLNWQDIDWSHTRAWADGGYYARVFVNVRGREPEGQVDDVDAYLHDLSTRLATMPGPGGAPLGNRVFDPRRCYKHIRNIAPDLIVYPGNLRYRANATVLPKVDGSSAQRFFAVENDTGVDGANHAQDGIWLLHSSSPALATGQRDAQIYDVAPTVLHLLGEEISAEMIGHSLIEV